MKGMDDIQRYSCIPSRQLFTSPEVSQSGQSLLEYAMILMLVTMVVLVILLLLGPAIGNLYSNIMYNI